MPGIEELTVCEYCSSQLKDPWKLPCNHIFCKTCISGNLAAAGKLVCRTCAKQHALPGGNLEKISKPSALATFLVGYKNDSLSIANSTDVSVIDGVCPECNPPNKIPKQKEGEPPIVLPITKISKCFHCQQALCQNCKNKHYGSLRQETGKALAEIEEGAGNIKITNEQLNEARKRKINEYSKTKGEISTKHQEILQKLKIEEQKMFKLIDEAIKNEEEKITSADKAAGKLVANKETATNMRKVVASENEMQRLADVCLAFNKIKLEWIESLTAEATKADPSKETKLNYVAPKMKDDILGTLADKSYDTKVKAATIPGQKSGICTIV